MMHFYWIYCGDEYLCCVKAFSSSDAEKQAYMKHGSASRYSGRSRDDFRAVRINMS